MLFRKLLGVCVVGAVLLAQKPLVLVDGTPLKLRLTRNLSSKTEETGNTVDFEVLEDIHVSDTFVVSKGADCYMIQS